MKKISFFCMAACIAAEAFAQFIPRHEFEDSTLGWMKVYNFKGAKAPMKVDDKVYSVAQLSICDSFANWIQASYVPRGGWGDVKRMVSTKLGLYNQYEAGMPQSYGAYSLTYMFLKYNSAGKFALAATDAVLWKIIANGAVGIAAEIFGSPERYYFTLPTFAQQGYDNNFPQVYGLETHPNTSKYFTYFKRNSKSGNEKTVVLFRNNRMPFVKVTKGEYLESLGDAITRYYEKEKKRIFEAEQGRQPAIDKAMVYLNANHEKRKLRLQENKEKYKDRLHEVAEIHTDEPSILLENAPDVFEGNGGNAFKLPVYKIDPAVAALCKTDAPQWIVITWHGDVFEKLGKHQHESVINNFNFDYVYNFFFDPQKVKGQPYRPLRSPLYREAVVLTASSEQSQKNAADKSIFFFDDFSTTTTGKSPVGWRSELSLDGATALVARPEGLEGAWVVMNNDYSITVNLSKKPLPQNFTLSYDIAAAENFVWGAKGLTLRLAKQLSPGNDESFLKLRLRPGHGGTDGEVALETKFPNPPGYLNASKWMKAAGFSSNKKYNRVTVTIKKSEELLQLFIDNRKIGEFEKAIPAAHLFNSLSFHSGSTGETNKYFISNIKITRD
jgi:hypothetical protein